MPGLLLLFLLRPPPLAVLLGQWVGWRCEEGSWQEEIRVREEKDVRGYAPPISSQASIPKPSRRVRTRAICARQTASKTSLLEAGLGKDFLSALTLNKTTHSQNQLMALEIQSIPPMV